MGKLRILHCLLITGACVLVGCKPSGQAEKHKAQLPVANDSTAYAKIELNLIDEGVLNVDPGFDVVKDAGSLVISSKNQSLEGGIKLFTGEDFEKIASGNALSVEVEAWSRGDEALSFALRYSTNEVGNSGWQEFVATSQPQVFKFSYSVKSLVSGHNDILFVKPLLNADDDELVLGRITLTVG